MHIPKHMRLKKYSNNSPLEKVNNLLHAPKVNGNRNQAYIDEIVIYIKNAKEVASCSYVFADKLTTEARIIHQNNPKSLENEVEKLYTFCIQGNDNAKKILKSYANSTENPNNVYNPMLALNLQAAYFARACADKTEDISKKVYWFEKRFERLLNSSDIAPMITDNESMEEKSRNYKQGAADTAKTISEMSKNSDDIKSNKYAQKAFIFYRELLLFYDSKGWRDNVKILFRKINALGPEYKERLYVHVDKISSAVS